MASVDLETSASLNSAGTSPPSNQSSSLGSSPDKTADNSGSEDEDDVEDDPKHRASTVRQLRVQERQRPVEANRWISPLSLQFSQMRSNETFRCGRHIDDAVQDIHLVRCAAEEANQLLAGDLAHGSGVARSSKAATDSQTCRVWRLECPFPAVRVLKWRCKLRDGTTGRPKVDALTGAELYDTEERWFSLDNRRLCSLQKVAVSVWPDHVFVAVMEIPAASQKSRDVKKFRTLDCGYSIFIGSRREGEVTRWSWRAQVGLEAATESREENSTLGPSVPPARGAGAGRPIRDDCSGFLSRRGQSDQRKRDAQKKSMDSADDETQSQIHSSFGLDFFSTRLGFIVFMAICIGIRLLCKLMFG